MQILNATGLHRKSGGAQWRDLRFLSRVGRATESKSESGEASPFVDLLSSLRVMAPRGRPTGLMELD
jgi:hypothetical protein